MLENIETRNASRLADLHGLEVLDSGAEKVYDDIIKLTADICQVPLCAINVVEEERQWFRSEVGLGVLDALVDESICAHAIIQNDYLEIEDTQDHAFSMYIPLCQGDNPVRFYAGAILRTSNGVPLGTLCILDYKPRRLNGLQRRVLEVNANSVMRHLELTRALVEKVVLIEQSSGPPLSEDEKRLIEKTHVLFQSLTPREKEILKLIAGNSKSLSSKEIARALDISYRTVHHHRAHIMTKMQVHSVAELIALSLKARIFA